MTEQGGDDSSHGKSDRLKSFQQHMLFSVGAVQVNSQFLCDEIRLYKNIHEFPTFSKYCIYTVFKKKG